MSACGVYSGSYVDICPETLHTDGVPAGPPVPSLRPCAPAEAEATPPWLVDLADRPLVYVTLGTVFNHIDRFRPIIAGVAELDSSVLVTVGITNDPAALGTTPANVRVERFVPQHLVLPYVDVMVGHGGSGSMLAAFSHGVPQLMLPSGAYQFLNAEVATRRGLARALLPPDVTAARVQELVRDLLADAAARQAARSLAEEISAMPSPEHVAVQLLAQGAPT